MSFKWRLLSFSLVLCLLFSFCVPVSAAERNIKVILRGHTNMWSGKTISAKTVEFDVKPKIINGRTYVPIRAVAQELGYLVGWNQTTKCVTIGTEDVTDWNSKQLKRWTYLFYCIEANNSDKPANFGKLLTSNGREGSVGEILGPKYGKHLSASLYVGNKTGSITALNTETNKLVSSHYTMDSAPVIIDGRTLIPVRAAAEMMGLTVEWVDSTSTVYLSAY